MAVGVAAVVATEVGDAGALAGVVGIGEAGDEVALRAAEHRVLRKFRDFFLFSLVLKMGRVGAGGGERDVRVWCICIIGPPREKEVLFCKGSGFKFAATESLACDTFGLHC